ncbi:PAS fold-containing protein [Xaviernesmea oryzae]|uniref:PAS fold-containing protein n=1 Tax=Xaviernesmea oryzae TaxID=464029 RepID=A0A1X7GUE6_9HYPH|nr:PAS fold-containing protein [Xaviernesmea oryzae]
MPFWLELARTDPNRQHEIIGLSAEEVVELATAFRLYGFWRFDIETGHLFATEDVSRIFGIEHREGPMNLVEIGSRIHPEDMPLLMETFERASAGRLTYHNIYRIKSDAEHYKYVRTVGKFRDRPGSSGEVVGITYEFFERRPGVTFFLDEPDD